MSKIDIYLSLGINIDAIQSKANGIALRGVNYIKLILLSLKKNVNWLIMSVIDVTDFNPGCLKNYLQYTVSHSWSHVLYTVLFLF